MSINASDIGSIDLSIPRTESFGAVRLFEPMRVLLCQVLAAATVAAASFVCWSVLT